MRVLSYLSASAFVMNCFVTRRSVRCPLPWPLQFTYLRNLHMESDDAILRKWDKFSPEFFQTIPNSVWQVMLWSGWRLTLTKASLRLLGKSSPRGRTISRRNSRDRHSTFAVTTPQLSHGRQFADSSLLHCTLTAKTRLWSVVRDVNVFLNNVS